jgi:hypothetical protein
MHFGAGTLFEAEKQSTVEDFCGWLCVMCMQMCEYGLRMEKMVLPVVMLSVKMLQFR